MKVSIVGGGGRVGSAAAFAMLGCGFLQELALVDASHNLAEGEALDLRHATSLVAPHKVYAGGPEILDGSDFVVITAGLRRKPEESRLELINRNAGLFRSILDDIRNASLPEGAIIVVVTNPVDIMTQIAVDAGIVSADRVIGLGTLVDTARFRSLIGESFSLDPTGIDAVVLGEHGDSMVPILSEILVNGVPIQSFPGYSSDRIDDIAARVKQSGAEVLRLKGGAGWVVGSCVRTLIETIVLDKHTVLPVSTFQRGALGISGVCLSLPTIMGKSGVVDVVEIRLNDKEISALRDCEAVLKDRLSRLE